MKIHIHETFSFREIDELNRYAEIESPMPERGNNRIRNLTEI